MRKTTIVLFLILFISCPNVLALSQRRNLVSKGVPGELSVELIRHPEGTKILDPKPEFAWIVPSEAKIQRGYQILVATSKKNISKNIGDVWDSGNVRSNQSTNVEFQGRPLEENKSYFWKVRILDKENRLSTYSQPQKFITGNFERDAITENYFQVEHIKPVGFYELKEGSYLADFGKAAFATLNIHFNPNAEDTITVRMGEKLKDGAIDRNPGGTIRYQEVKLKVTPQQSHYQIDLIPDARNTNHLAIAMPDSFPVLLPYRYVEIETEKNKLKAENLLQEAYFNYFDEASSSFESSDTILNQVWDLCKYSIKATTFAGYYVDGDRERIPYEADAYLNQLSHYGVDNEYAIGRKTIEYFFDSKPTWPTEWQLHVAMMVYQDYMYTGNTELIERFYERLKVKTLMDLEVEDGFISIESPNHNADFLLQLGFPDTTRRLKDIVDWPPESYNFGGKKGYQKGERDGYVFKRINTVVNGFYYHNMKIMSEFASVLNKPEEALDFELRAAKVKKSVNEQLYNKEKGYYVDGVGTDHGSLHANMILLAFDVVPESRKQSVVNHVKSRGMACSVYGAQYLLEALYKAGEENYALGLMTATHDRSWYNMIKMGSTITLEAWDMKYKTNADWNHAWGAVPANIIPRFLWGIRPAEPGFDLIAIQPQLYPLKSSSIIVPTIKGSVKASYERVSEQLQLYNIEIPANSAGIFEMVTACNEVIIINGEEVDAVSGAPRLEPGPNLIEVRIP